MRKLNSIFARKLTCLALAIGLSCSGAAFADVKMPAIFGDHMVLQRDLPVPVWGSADPGEQVTVSIAGSTPKTAAADSSGKWMVKLDKLKPGEPLTLTVKGKNTITLQDVLVGDVWVCSGQSNMEFGLGGAHNAKEEIPKANHPTLRIFLLQKKIAFEPQQDCVGKWEVCTPATIGKFTAVGYFFGKELNQDLGTPIGLIGTYWGGTPAQSWTSLAALEADSELEKAYGEQFPKLRLNMPQAMEKFTTQVLPKWQQEHEKWVEEIDKPYKEALAKWNPEAAKAKAAGQPEPPKPQLAKPEPRRPGPPDQSPGTPTVLSNGMIAPIVPFGIKGAIWYQGESNSGAFVLYRKLFPAMITDWRKRWGQGDFPFLFVQLANFMARRDNPSEPSSWAGLREAQSKTLSLPNTGMAVIIDIGEGPDIHPKDKLDVGHRLALAAKHVAYGQNIVYSGPTCDSMNVEGDTVRVHFNNIGTGLVIGSPPPIRLGETPATPASSLKGFAIAGADKKFVWADAKIDVNDVVVRSDQVKSPVAVRYGWGDNPEVNLYNKEGLPASPFRTDDWP
jgi:sialate O-acetylesterase